MNAPTPSEGLWRPLEELNRAYYGEGLRAAVVADDEREQLVEFDGLSPTALIRMSGLGFSPTRWRRP